MSYLCLVTSLVSDLLALTGVLVSCLLAVGVAVLLVTAVDLDRHLVNLKIFLKKIMFP